MTSISSAKTVPELVSIVTPAFNEARNLRALYERLRVTLRGMDADWEWLIVDDHSRDGTFDLVRELAQQDRRVKGVRLARNSGAHMALLCGLHRAAGDCAVVLAADLQDPPEVVPRLVTEWEQGAQVVWAGRETREGEGAGTLGAALLYYWIMRRLVGMETMPERGADFFLVDRRVLDALKLFRETNVSVPALITWMGFRQREIGYTKQSRQHGASGWSLRKKLKLLVDSITSFTYLPIRLMSYLGCAVSAAGFIYAGIVFLNFIFSESVQGWSSLMVVLLVLNGIQMTMLGVLGEYLWRALDESRQRPRFLVEDEAHGDRSPEEPPEADEQPTARTPGAT